MFQKSEWISVPFVSQDYSGRYLQGRKYDGPTFYSFADSFELPFDGNILCKQAQSESDIKVIIRNFGLTR